MRQLAEGASLNQLWLKNTALYLDTKRNRFMKLMKRQPGTLFK